MATAIPVPPPLAMPFANNGDKNTLPTADAGNGSASLNNGFPVQTETPISQGGIPPSRRDMNAMGYLGSSALCLIQQGAVFSTFDQNLSNAIGGYAAGAILSYIDNLGKLHFLRSAVNNNTVDFNTDPSAIGNQWVDVTGGAGGGIPVGSVYASPSANAPAGAFALNGQVIENCQTEYRSFWTWVNNSGARIIDNATFESEVAATGNCGGFVIDGANVRLPLVKDFIQGSDGTDVGTSNAAGLPDIELALRVDVSSRRYYSVELPEYGNSDYGGSLYMTSNNDEAMVKTDSASIADRGGDLLKSDVYGNSETVQPAGVRFMWVIQVESVADNVPTYTGGDGVTVTDMVISLNVSATTGGYVVIQQNGEISFGVDTAWFASNVYGNYTSDSTSTDVVATVYPGDNLTYSTPLNSISLTYSGTPQNANAVAGAEHLEAVIRFTMAATSTADPFATLPAIQWVGGTPEIELGKSYIISIKDGLGVCCEVSE